LLVSLATGTAGDGAALPPANIYGEINMSATTGKVALVDNYDFLTGACPLGNPHIMDFVGYGSTASCREGSANAPAPSNTASITRTVEENVVDTNDNGADFAAGAPNPFRDAPIVELGPQVIGTDPQFGSTIAPRDATIEVNFTEQVNVSAAWFDITCATTGPHHSVTTASNGSSHYITPNDAFAPGESCTVTVYKDQVSDVDTDDNAPNTDTLPADYVWTFSVATGDAPPFPASVHLGLGNPSGAVADPNVPANYLMEKPEFSLSYNRDDGRPNWVSWHLSAEWVGTLQRLDTFRADPALPAEWYRVQSFDFQNSGFDRGHMVPNADRDVLTARPTNQATFLMTNILPQAPDNNQGPWANFENYLRTLIGTTTAPTNELYIVAGGSGVGGTGSDGFATTIANGKVKVPAYTWKVALVLPASVADDASRVSCATRTIAVIMPNTQGIRTNPNNPSDWENYLTTVDAVEALTGFDFFSNVPAAFQRCVEAGVNGANPKNDSIFSALTSPTLEAGAATAVVSGVLSLDGMAPTGDVAITLMGTTISAPIGANGHFSATFTTSALTPGTYPISYTYAGDANFHPAVAGSTLTVADTTAPAITTVTATPDRLGPANHKMIDVAVAYTATDFSGAPVCALTVSSNEPVNGAGDGNTIVDWQVVDAHHVTLRAERAGGGTGRIYTVTVRCTDASGNLSTATGSVTVAK
jgi:endonuclease G